MSLSMRMARSTSQVANYKRRLWLFLVRNSFEHVMKYFQTISVLAFWLVCGAFVLDGAYAIWPVASHPLAEVDFTEALLFYAAPFLVASLAAIGLRTRPVALKLLLVSTVLLGFLVARLNHGCQTEWLCFLE